MSNLNDLINIPDCSLPGAEVEDAGMTLKKWNKSKKKNGETRSKFGTSVNKSHEYAMS